MTCTFFGHYFIFEEIKPEVKAAVIDLIENHGVKKFYVGARGEFDRMCFEVLRETAEKYDIDYKMVLSSVPGEKQAYDKTDYSLTVVPDGVEKKPPRFRIDFCNRWMVKQADYVITYINHTCGSGAAIYAELAEKKGKKIIKTGKM